MDTLFQLFILNLRKFNSFGTLIYNFNLPNQLSLFLILFDSFKIYFKRSIKFNKLSEICLNIHLTM
jgi:hypothetical protein